MHWTDYSDDEDIKITTIDDALYINMKNDVSFIIDSYMSMFEQQSTKNPNMPLRGLMYFGNLYDSYIESNGLNIYGKKLIKKWLGWEQKRYVLLSLLIFAINFCFLWHSLYRFL